MNRRGFLLSTLASALITKLPRSVIVILEHIPGLHELIARATTTSAKAGLELADAVLAGTDYIERATASDALGNWLINDMKSNPGKYLP